MFKKEFDSSFSGFMTDGAKWLVENTDIKLVGKKSWNFALLAFLSSYQYVSLRLFVSSYYIVFS